MIGRNLKPMKITSESHRHTSKKYWLLTNRKAKTPVQTLTGHLIKLCLLLALLIASMMTSYGQTVQQQQTPLTVPELKVLLRQSLDREKVLVTQRDAALDHVVSLEKQVADQEKADTVDKALNDNLTSQLDLARAELKEIRQALSDERVAAAKYSAALDRAEVEVEHQKKKVKAANRRTVLGIMGGLITGAAVILATRH
jgi:hypothetical protein